MTGAIAWSLALALLLDWKWGEVNRWHPLVGFGWIADRAERALNKSGCGQFLAMALGVLAWLLTVMPLVLVAWLVSLLSSAQSVAGVSVVGVIIGGIVLYVAIGWQALLSHAKAVSEPLEQGDLAAARIAVAMIVSRDTSGLDEQQVASAATESVLENGADALFGAIFWFALFGLPGVVLYRLSNTLDAMWGYRNERYRRFGWMAARVDDLLNFVPARLTALSYALVGDVRLAMAAWRQQGGTWKSPNAGPVMSAGAGAINVSLGGGAIYHGRWQERPQLGPETGNRPSAESIGQATRLVNRALGLWFVIVIAIAVADAAAATVL
ncbi:MAG: cobalamin biosynthesis protein [Proteobacteria bacterium]|nr:MAG: cobalamin biosynthesis protein [Pseudomonadota bacterium]PIE37077.1 MAG: cobalamin biosynthesis protein [Gammaproteobacteria bacterium]